MNLLMVNDGGYILAILIVLFIMFAIPVVLFILGLALRNKKTSKTLLIIATVYVLIGLGICGSMMI